MPAKKHRPEEIIGKLREVEIVLGQGGTTAKAWRRIAVSKQTNLSLTASFHSSERIGPSNRGIKQLVATGILWVFGASRSLNT